MDIICSLMTMGYEGNAVGCTKAVSYTASALLLEGEKYIEQYAERSFWEIVKEGLVGKFFAPKQETILPKMCVMDYVAEYIGENVGRWVIGGGTLVETIGILTMVIGFNLIRFHNTKVLRWGFLIYLLGILIQLIGLALV